MRMRVCLLCELFWSALNPYQTNRRKTEMQKKNQQQRTKKKKILLRHLP